MTTTSIVRFDFPAFKDAFEGKNYDRWVSFYDDDAEWIEYRDASPPRSPNRMIGKQAIAQFLASVCPADFAIMIGDEVIAGDRAAFSVTVSFPDGKRVFEHVIIQTRDDKITRQVDVEAWD
jgi:ketosteroid isomerase-like protein